MFDFSLSGLIKAGIHSARAQALQFKSNAVAKAPSVEGYEDYFEYVDQTTALLNELYAKRDDSQYM